MALLTKILQIVIFFTYNPHSQLKKVKTAKTNKYRYNYSSINSPLFPDSLVDPTNIFAMK